MALTAAAAAAAATNGDGHGTSDGIGDGDKGKVHPLLLPPFMRGLFPYLDVPTLKLTRLVCKTWKESAEPLLLEKAVAVLDGEKHGEKHLGRLVESMGQTPERKYANYYWTQAQLFNRWNPFKPFFDNHGRHIKSLKLPRPIFEGQPCYFKVSILDALLESCVNLEEIEVFCPKDDFMDPSTRLSCQKSRLKSVTILTENGIHKQLLQNLINTCPELNTFVVKSFLTPKNIKFVETFLELGEFRRIKLDKLVWLDLGATSNLLTTSAALKSLCRQKMNLSFLEITLDYRLIEERVLMKLFHHICGTLRYFVLNNYPATLPLEFTVTFPPILTRLEKIEIRTGTNVLLIGPLKSAVDLPALKSIILYRTPVRETKGPEFMIPGVEYNFNQCWHLLGDAWMTKRQNKVELLQVPCGFTRADHLRNLTTVFPNLRELRLQDPSTEVIKAIFTLLTQLEKLSFRMKAFPEDIDSILTGLHPKICAAMVKKRLFKFADPNQLQNQKAGLQDMKNLKYLELRQWFDSPGLTEVTLWHGLIHLQRAIQVDLNGCQRFSNKSVAALKTVLGPTCFVNIDQRIGRQDHVNYGLYWARDAYSIKDRKY